MNELTLVVKLYRSSNKPSYDGIKFAASINYTDEIKEILTSLMEVSFNGGTLEEVVIDGNDIYDLTDLPEKGQTVNYSFNVARRSAETFYPTLDDFIAINSLKKGIMPESFYIVEDDYYSLDVNASKPAYILRIEKICKLIICLAKIAHFHDIKNDSKGSFFRLVFVLHSESKSTTAVIETTFSKEMLNGPELNVDLIESLSFSDASKDNHYLEKLNTYRNTLIEYAENSNNSFASIIKNWKEINTLYSNNLAVYMSAFSFHKARKEVTEAEIEFAEKISKVVSEITNKSLAIPISLVGAISIFQLTGNEVAYISFVGVLLTSIITHLVAVSQRKQLENISHAKETFFNSMKDRLDDEQDVLIKRLDEAINNLSKNETFCIRILDLMKCLSWLPTSVGTIALLLKLLG